MSKLSAEAKSKSDPFYYFFYILFWIACVFLRFSNDPIPLQHIARTSHPTSQQELWHGSWCWFECCRTLMVCLKRYKTGIVFPEGASCVHFSTRQVNASMLTHTDHVEQKSISETVTSRRSSQPRVYREHKLTKPNIM